MKRIRFVFLIALVLVTLSSCADIKIGIRTEQTDGTHSGNSQNSNTELESQTEEKFYSVSDGLLLEENNNSTNGESRKILVAYFSWSENAIQDNIDAMTSASVRVPGNVAQLAAWIAEETGGDLFSIQVAERYPADWDGCLTRANEEKEKGIHLKLYYVSLDTVGEIGWESGTFRKPGRPDAHVIEILTEETPLMYRAYLREKGVSYIIAGSNSLDCKVAAEKLKRLFKIDTVLICGGGTVNWTFIQQGVVDELSLLLAPSADGDSETPTVFEKSELLTSTVPVEFTLKNIELLKDSGIHLTYLVKQ